MIILILYRLGYGFVYGTLIAYFGMATLAEFGNITYDPSLFEIIVKPVAYDAPVKVVQFVFTVFDVIEKHKFNNETFGSIIFLVSKLIEIGVIYVLIFLWFIYLLVYMVCSFNLLIRPIMYIVGKPINFIFGLESYGSSNFFEYVLEDPLEYFGTSSGEILSDIYAMTLLGWSMKDVAEQDYKNDKLARKINRTLKEPVKYTRIMKKQQ